MKNNGFRIKVFNVLRQASRKTIAESEARQ